MVALLLMLVLVWAAVAPTLTNFATLDGFIGVLNKQPNRHVLQYESKFGSVREREVPRVASGVSNIPLVSFLGVSLAAAMGAFARRKRKTAQRCFPIVTKESNEIHEVINNQGARTMFTKDEEAAFLEKRIKGLEELMPVTEQEFDDKIEELHWQWCRTLLPFSDRHRGVVANIKRNSILKQKELYKQLMLFKPLALKHPTLIKRYRADLPDLQCSDMKLQGDAIDQTEKIAGFTYEDFVRETQNYEGTKLVPGEIVPGVVARVYKDGAHVEIGAKTWAYISLENVSLASISSVRDVLQEGQEIEAMISGYATRSNILGDETAEQLLLSMTELQKQASWDTIESIMRADPGTEPIMPVSVMSMKTWGAIVQTRQGLFGWIPNIELGALMGDTAIVGTEIDVEIVRASRDLDNPMDTSMPVRPGDFAITFTHKKAAQKALASKMREGQVLDATITVVEQMFVSVDVDGFPVNVRKIDISGTPRFEIFDLFAVGESIKVYAQKVDESTGEIRLSIRALEGTKGEILTNKAKVFEMAEETGRKFYEAAKKEQEQAFANLSDALEGGVGGGGSGGGGGSVDDIMGEDDDMNF